MAKPFFLFDGFFYLGRKWHTAAVWGALLMGLAAMAQEKQKVIILSASYGSGHNTSAEATRKLISTFKDASPGLDVEVIYTEKYARFGLGALSVKAFSYVYQNYPEIYNGRFQETMKSARGKTSAAEISNHFFNEDELLEDLREKNPSLVISTYHFASIMLARLRAEGKITPQNFKIGWIDTDFVHEPFFYLISSAVEMTFMAHPFLTEERIRLGVPAHKVVTTGLPINPLVFKEFTQEDRLNFLKNALNTPDQKKNPAQGTWVDGAVVLPGKLQNALDPEAFTVTIASGKAGLGDYRTIFKGLVEEAKKRNLKLQVIAVCGENKKNYQQLTEFYQDEKRQNRMDGVRLIVTRLIDNDKLITYVRSSQLFIGKSGSQSPIEAAILRVPPVLLDMQIGQEIHTAEFFKKNYLAEVVHKDEQGLTGAKAFAYLEDQERMAKLKIAQEMTRKSYDMRPIAEFAKDVLAEMKAKGQVSLVSQEKKTFLSPCLKIFKGIPLGFIN